MLSLYGQWTRQFKMGSKGRIFLGRMKWRPKKIVLILKILGNAFSSGKQNEQIKKPQEFVWKFIEKYMTLKYLNQLRKKTSIVSSWSWSHSPIDNCLSDIKSINHKQLDTNTGYAAIHYSNPDVSIASSFV